ncbi:MAG: hypothetical protein R3B13_25465 [Polyangiaceae bacterium]
MRLLSARLVGVGPFRDEVFPFYDESGSPRAVTVIVGAGGVGKTTLLSAIAHTRPGNAVVTAALGHTDDSEALPFVITDWGLGVDDPERPHALRVSTPTSYARGFDADDAEVLRRREQAHFDKRAREGGFALLVLPATRWFSRTPLNLSAPARSVGRYDVRAAIAFEDASRGDLTREIKQALAYAEIAAALASGGADRGRGLELLGRAMRAAVQASLERTEYAYEGLDAVTLEPTFRAMPGRLRRFDELPTAYRHLVAFAALTVRTLWAAYPGQDPASSEGVVMIDEVDSGLEPSLAAAVLDRLSACLPHVQWIATTSSPAAAAGRDAPDILALRRTHDDHVELHVGSTALTH